MSKAIWRLSCHGIPSGAIDFGRVSYLGNFEYELTGAVVSLRKRGQVPLTRANLEDFFIEIAAGSADPVDIIRVAVDLAHTLLASQISQKVSNVLSSLHSARNSCLFDANRVMNSGSNAQQSLSKTQVPAIFLVHAGQPSPQRSCHYADRSFVAFPLRRITACAKEQQTRHNLYKRRKHQKQCCCRPVRN